jgi:hypothetical protein
MSDEPIKGFRQYNIGSQEVLDTVAGTGRDPTEMVRRQMIPEVNQPAVEALRAAGAKVTEEAGGPDTEVTLADADAILKRRDDLAKQILRDELVAKHGEDNVFDTDQLSEHFVVIGFAAPCVVVTRKADNQKGSMFFTHRPRFYFGFQPDLR